MPPRRRRRPGGAPAEFDLSTPQGRKAAQQSAAQAFAQRQRAEREEQSRLARERNEARRKEQRRQELVEAKDRAAARLRDVRRRNVPGAVRAEADAAYRAALDALLRDEQGLPPVEEDERERDDPRREQDEPHGEAEQQAFQGEG